MQSTNSGAESTPECPPVPSTEMPEPQSNGPKLWCEIAHSRDELLKAFSLVYHSYRRAGLVDENPRQLRLTPFHLLPTTEVFVTKLGTKVVSTVSLVGDGELGLPLDPVYPHNVEVMRGRGLRVAEICSLADRRESPVRFIETFASMGRMLAQVAMKRGYDGLVAATHPKHARLYQRILPFEQIGQRVNCPYANGNPAVMLALVFDDQRGSEFYERFFGSMSSSTDTSPRPWDRETYEYFQKELHANHLQSERPMSGQTASVTSSRRPIVNSRIDR